MTTAAEHWLGFDEAARRLNELDPSDPDYLALSGELKSAAAYHEAMLTDDPAMADMLLRASEEFSRSARRARRGGEAS